MREDCNAHVSADMVEKFFEAHPGVRDYVSRKDVAAIFYGAEHPGDLMEALGVFRPSEHGDDADSPSDCLDCGRCAECVERSRGNAEEES